MRAGWLLLAAYLGLQAFLSPVGRARVARPAQKQAFYDYLANDWSLSDGRRPWESLGFSMQDLLPFSEAEERAVRLLDGKVPKWRQGFLTPDDAQGLRRRFRRGM